tara:strand:+ start:3789 stop:7328 length:3540 start_codon:yes stop_codon:yes gene_type:complete
MSALLTADEFLTKHRARQDEKNLSLSANKFLTKQRASSTKEQTEDAFSAGDQVTLSNLREGVNFNVIQDYMSDRFGMNIDKYDREEIVDSYINNMRSFSIGNSITTLQELSHLNRGDEQELELRRKKAGDAYKLFDSMAGVFSEGDAGDKVDAVYDYARELILDPVNILSLGVGKVAASGLTKAAGEIAKRTAREAAEASVKAGAIKGVTRKSTIETAKKEASRRAYTKALQSSSYKTALNSSAKREIIYAGLADTAAATGIDALRQKARIKAGAQDEYNPLEGAFSTIGGLSGTGLALGLFKLRGISGNSMLSLELERSAEIQASANKLAGTEKSKPTKKELRESAKKADAVKIKEAMDAMKVAMSPWKEKVIQGIDIRYKDLDDKSNATDAILAKLFFLGDKENGIRGVSSILIEAGVKPYSKRDKEDRFTNYLLDAIDGLDEAPKKDIKDAFEEIFNRFDSPSGNIGLEKFLKVDAAEVKDAGSRLQRQSQLAKLLKSVDSRAEDLATDDVVESILDPLVKTNFLEAGRETTTKTFEGMQQNFIRMLVTHPGTTALNVIGWANATATQTLSDMLRGGLYGGAAALKALTGDKVGAVQYRNLASQMVNLQKQKLKNMVDPYSTFEQTMDYLTFRPDAQKEMFRYMIGGVEVDAVLKELQLSAGEKITRSNFEKGMNIVQTAYGVKAQDFLTKSQEFMYAIDKNIRIEYGVSYNEFLQNPALVKHLTDKDSAKYAKFLQIETKSVEDALRNTFSKRYGGSKGTLQVVAKLIEEARTMPLIGAMVPFGQFFNNTLGFMFDHTGVSLLHKGFAGNKNRDAMTLATKAAVGWGLIGVNTVREMKNLDEGLAWYEERNSTGAIVNRMYDFPYSFYKMVGRVGAHQIRDEEVPEDLYNAALSQFGTEQVSRTLGESAGYMMDTIYLLLQGDTEAGYESAKKALGASVAMYASGVTRFVDPANQVIALSRGEDYVAVDRKQGIKELNNSVRYIDQIYELASGKSITPEKQSALSGEALGAPIGRLVGYREVPPQSTIQQLFNDVGRPQWMTEIRSSVPEAANAFNETVFPVLEMYADQLVESNKWRSLSLKDKVEQLNKLLGYAKKDSKEFLKNSYDRDDNKVGMIMQITNRSINKRDLKEALEIFGTTEKELWTLDVPQLELIDYYLSKETERDKRFKVDFTE